MNRSENIIHPTLVKAKAREAGFIRGQFSWSYKASRTTSDGQM